VRLSQLKLYDNAGNYVATAVRSLESDSVFDQYLTEGKRWISVTPAILPGHDDDNQKKRHRLMTKMFTHAELPAPISVTQLPNRPRFKANSRHGHHKYRQMHCIVEFAEPVSGVLSLGSGRHYGLGIFAKLQRSLAWAGDLRKF
jgi:CRISPR-associated protein Csb2